LFSDSEEESELKGLGIIAGRVKKFTDTNLKIPHMGWNRIKITVGDKNGQSACPLLKDIDDGTYMYFVHSYYVEPEDKNVIAASTDYGIEFTCFIYKDNIYAMQFHPEKSQEKGLRILENFVKL